MSHPRLRALHRWWLARRLASGALSGAGFGLPLAAFLTDDRVRFVLFAVGASLLGALAAWLRRESRADVARHLDRVRPELEDSVELLTAGPDGLSGIARRQRSLVAERLEAASGRGLLPFGALWRSLATCLVGGILAAAILSAQARIAEPPSEPVAAVVEPAVAGVGEGVVVHEIEHRVRPPAYTGIEPREGEGLEASFPAASDVAWRVRTAGPVEAAVLESPEGAVALRQISLGSWAAQRRIHRTSAVRLVLRGDERTLFAGPWARLEVVPDRPPEVRIVSPDRLVERDSEDLGPLPLVIEVEDEYGVQRADLILTLALGAGEMVEFRERRRPLPPGTGGVNRRKIETRVDLRELGMEPGSELFLRVEALDNRRPEPQLGRSATRIVRIRGGSGAAVDLAGGLPVITPPDMFRSQRQIILDTEALLADRPALARDELVRRSESIGFDQRALRMRYGVLLGDEFVSGAVAEEVSHDDEHDPESHEGGDLDEALGELPTGVVHTHDSAEMATFFPDAIRTALRDALGAMWEAEKALRSADPEAALPHENRALELLQEIRRQSRVYVQRIGFDPPPIEPDRARLTGELDEILRPRRQVEDAREEESAPVRAYRLLKEGSGDAEALDVALEEAGETLAERAIESPGVGLEGLGALTEVRRALASGRPPPAEAVGATLEALWSIAPAPEARPVRRLDDRRVERERSREEDR